MSKEKEDKTVFNSEKLNAQIWSVENMEARAHNNAIDKAIDIVDEARDLEAVTKNEELFLDAIVQRLNQLKK